MILDNVPTIPLIELEQNNVKFLHNTNNDNDFDMFQAIDFDCKYFCLEDFVQQFCNHNDDIKMI